MRRYYFAVRASEEGFGDAQVAELDGDASAFDYAANLARMARPRRDSRDTGWLVKVSDDTRPIVFALPVLPACA
jgi:hypothetical protein